MSFSVACDSPAAMELVLTSATNRTVMTTKTLFLFLSFSFLFMVSAKFQPSHLNMQETGFDPFSQACFFSWTISLTSSYQ